MAYFQDFEVLDSRKLGEKYQLTFRTDDLLSISVYSKDPELTVPFNVTKTNKDGEDTGFLIDSEGCINYPVLGRIRVIDMSRKGLEDYIRNRLIYEGLIKDPIVTVRLLNFKVLVLGEVKSPQVLSVKSDRLTLLDAIGMAGDLADAARRDRVAVIREIDGERMVLYHDLRNSKIFDSPCFYLKQNDIIYVEPNKNKASKFERENASNIRTWIMNTMYIVSSLVTLILVITQ